MTAEEIIALAKLAKSLSRHLQDRIERDAPEGYAVLLGTRYIENARLGGGTATAATALFGDYTWKATATSADLAAHEADTSTHGVTEIVGRTEVQTLTNKTLTAPTLSDFTNANHDHLDADDGGTLDGAAIASGTVALARLPTGTTSAHVALGDAAAALIATHAALATGVHGHTVAASFPGSPADGDTCYRTDHDTEYTFDGTLWLSQPFPIVIGSVRGSAVSTFNPGVGTASDDANSPIRPGRTMRVLAISSALRGGTGARVWTTRLRLDGAGSDSFACTNTITSVAATWVAAAQEAVGLSLTATNRLNVLTNATGGTETYAYSATLTCAWEAT